MIAAHRRALGVVLIALAAAGSGTGSFAGPAAATGTIAGQVRSRGGDAATDALVMITELRRQARVDAQGRYRFLHVPGGRYVLNALSERHGSAVVEVSVAADQQVDVDIELEFGVHERVVVTPNEDARGIPTVGQPVSVLEERELALRLRSTLGETMTSVPGVSSTAHAAGASRPVIRGFGGDRARILEQGLSVADASSTRSDNAVGTDLQDADGVEILRGPATLLYGSNAVAGVVNIVDQRVPSRVPERAIGGAVSLRAGSSANERSDGLVLDGGWQALAWRISAVQRQADDVKTPVSTLVNSDLETEQAGAGVSWMLGGGHVGIAHRGFDTDYGIPTPRLVRIDMQRRRWEATGEFPRGPGFVSGLRARLGYTDYEHAEAVTLGSFGSRFEQRTWEARVEAQHRFWSERGSGTFGAQLQDRDLTVDGPQAFLPPNRTSGFALFAFEQLELGPFTVQLGARWESADVESSGAVARQRSFSGFSASGSVEWNAAERPWGFGATVSRMTRLPTAEELASDGPHLSTFQYEIGNPDLVEERGSALELSARRTAGRVRSELTLFKSDYDDYAFLIPTGNTVEVDGEELPQLVTLQRDARLRGAEARVRIDLVHGEAHHLELELRADTIRGETEPTATGRWLPKIPPSRTALGVRYDGTRLWGGLELVRVARQDRVQLFEAPTEGHTLINASAGLRIHARSVVHDVMVVVTNLDDALGRNHVSPLKEIAPLPGRDVSVGYKVRF